MASSLSPFKGSAGSVDVLDGSDMALAGHSCPKILPFFNRVGSKLEFSTTSVTMRLASGSTNASGMLNLSLSSGSVSNKAQWRSVNPSTLALSSFLCRAGNRTACRRRTTARWHTGSSGIAGMVSGIIAWSLVLLDGFGSNTADCRESSSGTSSLATPSDDVWFPEGTVVVFLCHFCPQSRSVVAPS